MSVSPIEDGLDELNSDEKKQLREDMQRAAVRDILPTLAIVIIAIGVIYLFLNSVIDSVWFDVWAIGSVLVQLARFPLLKLSMSKPYSRRMDAVVLLSQAIGGLCWATLLLFWRSDMSVLLQLMFVLAPIGVCLGSVTSAGAWPSYSLAVIASAKIPFFMYALVSQADGLLTLTVPMLIFLALDVTLLRNYNRRLRESFELRIRNHRLINDLTAQNTNLERARKDSLIAADAKSDFLARMSHELRTPINGVMGSADMLSRTGMNASQQRWIETIQSSSDEMLTMVNQLLDHSRINDGKLVLDERTFDLPQCIFGCVEQQKNDHPNGDLKLNLSQSLPELFVADNYRLIQVLNQIIDNARKFSDNGEIVVDVGVFDSANTNAHDFETEQFISIDVVDNGIGIPADKMDTIFTDLEQLDGSMSRRYGGAGLGLTLSRQFVKLMGGRLSVQSTEGSGSTFSIQLPMRIPEQKEQQTTAQNEFSGLNVLVAEDNLVNQVVLESMLEELGCVVTLADDGNEALAAMKNTTFDVVFMDCQMPGMDGLEATTAARQEGIDVPIVAVTANALVGDRELCLESGMNDYVTKPVTQETIAQTLSHWLAAGSSNAMVANG